MNFMKYIFKKISNLVNFFMDYLFFPILLILVYGNLDFNQQSIDTVEFIKKELDLSNIIYVDNYNLQSFYAGWACNPTTKKITLNVFFKYFPSDYKKRVIYHELVHCVFNYHHTDVGIMSYENLEDKIPESDLKNFMNNINQNLIEEKDINYAWYYFTSFYDNNIKLYGDNIKTKIWSIIQVIFSYVIAIILGLAIIGNIFFNIYQLFSFLFKKIKSYYLNVTQ